MLKAILFDLDGTLADTARDLGAALNMLLTEYKQPQQPYENIRPIASHGARGLINLGFGLDKDSAEFPVLRERFLAIYHSCICQDTVLFDGVVEMLAHIKKKNLFWGIVTNKPSMFTERLVPKLLFPSNPAVVVSGDTTSEAKPSPIPILYAARCINVLPTECLYVGDAERDISAGRNAGMKTVLANWGYIDKKEMPDKWGADITIEHPLDILCYLP